VHEKYLGDSYDLVKRFWCESLGPVAPLYAHPRFVPSPIRSQYTAVTKIPILDARLEGAFGLLLDPHTGVPVADGLSSSASVGHAPLSFIVELNQKLRPEYLICFDQSYHRKHSLSKKGQMEAKLTFLHEKGMHAFYYVSHASFLFIAQKKPVLDSIYDRLLLLEIPGSRFEACPLPS